MAKKIMRLLLFRNVWRKHSFTFYYVILDRFISLNFKLKKFPLILFYSVVIKIDVSFYHKHKFAVWKNVCLYTFLTHLTTLNVSEKKSRSNQRVFFQWNVPKNHPRTPYVTAVDLGMRKVPSLNRDENMRIVRKTRTHPAFLTAPVQLKEAAAAPERDLEP